MVCYRDRAFCLAFEIGRCVNRSCFRAYDGSNTGGLDIQFVDLFETCKVRVEHGEQAPPLTGTGKAGGASASPAGMEG